jgi:hypothetical protein
MNVLIPVGYFGFPSLLVCPGIHSLRPVLIGELYCHQASAKDYMLIPISQGSDRPRSYYICSRDDDMEHPTRLITSITFCIHLCLSFCLPVCLLAAVADDEPHRTGF